MGAQMGNTLRILALTLPAIGLVSPAAGQVARVEPDPYDALNRDTRPLSTRWQTDYSGELEAGLAYVSQDNVMFGQYNGLYDKGAVVIGDARWHGWRGDSAQYWQLNARDLGLQTRHGSLYWGVAGKLRLGLLFDNQVQVKNDSARTPFLGEGSTDLTLPGSWVGGATTSDWSLLYPSLQGFDQKLERQRYGLTFESSLGRGWAMTASFNTEHKEGNNTVGAAIYTDAASPLAVLLPQAVDQRSDTLDLAFDYQGQALQLTTSYHFVNFDNEQQLLSWQNPYSAGFGPAVDYPNGNGGLAQAPDSQYHQLRLVGNWIIRPSLRLQLDGSFGRALQNDDFPLYTVNPGLVVYEPVPRQDLDGRLDTTTLGLKLIARPLRKLTLQGSYRLDDRSNDSPRDGYLYVRGDGADQPASEYRQYNAPHDTRKQAAAVEASYRLPKRTKLTLEYVYQQVDRRNAAVDFTRENSLRGHLNINTWQSLSARVELLYADLAADTYEWSQSYYSRFDSELINQTPDNQRYTNHPLLSQYQLANRERLLGKIDLNYLLSSEWNLGLNMRWQRDDYDKSTLGLIDQYSASYIFSANYQPHRDLSFSAYVDFNQYATTQSGRAFRGGVEKNAFAVAPPLPQASDPGRDWDVDSDDGAQSIGVAMQWQPAQQLALEFDYSYIDTRGENSFKTYGAADLATEPLPDRRTRQHQFRVSGHYHLRDNLSLNLHYQYFHFQGDNWAIDDVSPDTLGNVLGFGEDSPDESINYVGLSLSYRLGQ